MNEYENYLRGTYDYIFASTYIEDSKGNLHRRITGAGQKDFKI